MQLASGLTHEAVDHGQPQAGTLAHWLGGEKWVHRLRYHLRRHTQPIVFDTQVKIVTRQQTHCLRALQAEAEIFSVERHLAAIRQCIAGIEAQVEQGAFQLMRVNERWP
ncbi:hypothetical protein D3C81_2028140 [compost metagenome]